MHNDYAQKGIFIFFTIFLLLPVITLAHQPQIVTKTPVVVMQPEISRAYYAKLNGTPQIYLIQVNQPLNLYINILVPAIAGQKKDVSVMVLKDSKQLAILDGSNFKWKRFFEPFGFDTYWKGPEYKVLVEAGQYEVRVSSGKNDSRYALAIGEKEVFTFKEGLRDLSVVPQLKRSFFKESPISFILSPFGFGEVVIIYLLDLIVILILRAIFKKLRYGIQKNIGPKDRRICLIAGWLLLLLSISTVWSVILIFLSGLLLLTAYFRWCGLYSLIKKHH